MNNVPWAKDSKGFGATRYTGSAMENAFYGWGLNRFFMLSSAVGAGATAAHGATNFMQDAWNEDPNTFQNAGYAAGGVVGEAAFGAAAGWMGYDMWRQRSGKLQGDMTEVLRHQKGSGSFTYYDPDAKIRAGLGRKATDVSKMKNVTRGSLSTSGKFFKHGAWKRDILMLGLAPMLLGGVATAGLSAAGAFVDSAIQSKKQRDELNYDNRFFDTRQQDANTFQQVGMAMRNYQDTMTSVARIYHSR